MTALAHLAGARVLVTGGCGLIGSRIVQRLASAGACVTVLDRLDAYPFDYGDRFGGAPAAAELVVGDAGDPKLVGPLVARADIIVHAAAHADIAGCLSSPDRDFASNVVGVQTVLEAARKHRPERLVFTSSASVYDDRSRAETVPRFAEDDRLGVSSTYANSKLWGERQTHLYREHYGLRATVLRYFSVYGVPQVPKERSHSWCIALFAMRAHRHLPLELHGGGHQVRDFVHVDDVADATLLAASRTEALGATINVGTGLATSVAEIAEQVAGHFPGAERVSTARPRGDPSGGCADIRRMRRLLEWTPAVDLRAGIARYVSWVRANDDLVPAWLERVPLREGAR